MTRIRQFEIPNQNIFWGGDSPSPEKFLGGARPCPPSRFASPGSASGWSDGFKMTAVKHDTPDNSRWPKKQQLHITA